MREKVITQHRLDTIKVAVTRRVPGAYMASTVTAEAFWDRTADDVAFQIRAYVLGRKLPTLTRAETRTVSFQAPANWWQHFKADAATWPYLGRALAPWLRRRPPVMTTETRCVRVEVDMHRSALFPEASFLPQHPHLGASVLVCEDGPARWAVTTDDDPPTTAGEDTDPR